MRWAYLVKRYWPRSKWKQRRTLHWPILVKCFRPTPDWLQVSVLNFPEWLHAGPDLVSWQRVRKPIKYFLNSANHWQHYVGFCVHKGNPARKQRDNKLLQLSNRPAIAYHTHLRPRVHWKCRTHLLLTGAQATSRATEHSWLLIWASKVQSWAGARSLCVWHDLTLAWPCRNFRGCTSLLPSWTRMAHIRHEDVGTVDGSAYDIF